MFLDFKCGSVQPPRCLLWPSGLVGTLRYHRNLSYNNLLGFKLKDDLFKPKPVKGRPNGILLYNSQRWFGGKSLTVWDWFGNFLPLPLYSLHHAILDHSVFILYPLRKCPLEEFIVILTSFVACQFLFIYCLVIQWKFCGSSIMVSSFKDDAFLVFHVRPWTLRMCIHIIHQLYIIWCWIFL